MVAAVVIHIVLGFCGASLIARYHPEIDRHPPTPRVSIVDVELSPASPPAAPPPPAPLPTTEPIRPVEPPRPSVRQPVSKPRASRAMPQLPPQATQAAALPTTGTAPIISVPEVALGATGVRVAAETDTATATGANAPGSSSGGDEGGGAAANAATSIATIKTRAMPRGDFAYSLVKDYPLQAKQLGIEGKIRVKLIVDENGVVTTATLLNRLGYGLDDLAARRARQLAFDPARDTNDKPVRSVVIWTFDFSLPK